MPIQQDGKLKQQKSRRHQLDALRLEKSKGNSYSAAGAHGPNEAEETMVIVVFARVSLIWIIVAPPLRRIRFIDKVTQQ
ncbi:MAG: hypothetical protein U0175_22145 [Caldilineaceae bacterium]